jgi:replicative DNA helicase
MKQEEYILGAAMSTDASALTLIETIKSPHCFTTELRQAIFKAIISLFESGKRPDVINTPTECQKFIKQPENDIISYCIGLTAIVSGTSNQKELCEFVQDIYLKRRLQGLAPYLSNLHGNTDTFQEVMADHMLRLDEIEGENTQEGIATLEEMINETKEQILIQASSGGIVGTRTGIEVLDRTTGGLQDGHLITIAGRPGMGKSVLAMNIAYHVAKTERVIVFSREMTASELIKRIVASESDFTMQELFTNTIQANRVDQFNRAADQINETGLIIDEHSRRLGDLVYRVRKEARKGLKLVVIDYISLIDGQVKGGNDTANLTNITRTLKQLAKDLRIPIIQLAQLNREVENRPLKMPQLSDLKQSGSVEEDSSLVIFAYRPQYYDMDTFEDGSSSEGMADLIIAKNRNGNVGRIRLGFEGNKARFRDYNAVNNNEPQF